MTDLFLHIPKTGGTTLNTCLKWIYGPKNCSIIPERVARDPSRWRAASSLDEIERFLLVSGHFPFGFDQHIEGKHRYFTMLRDPVHRVISRYYQVRLSYPESSAGRLKLEEWHSSKQSNVQTSMISGVDANKEPEEALELAKKRLLKDFTAFGITGRYDESLILLKRRMRWSRLPLYVRGKVTKGKRPSVSDVPSRTKEKVREANAADMRLYAFATEKFGSMYSKEPDIDMEVNRFKRINAVVEQVIPYPLKLYRFVKNIANF